MKAWLYLERIVDHKNFNELLDNSLSRMLLYQSALCEEVQMCRSGGIGRRT
jgi:hypothetical protein